MSDMPAIESEPMLSAYAKYYAWKCKTSCRMTEDGFHFLAPEGFVIAGYALDFGEGVDYGHFFPFHQDAVVKATDMVLDEEKIDDTIEIVPLFCVQVGQLESQQ